MIRATLLFLTLAVGLFAGLVHLRADRPADSSEPAAAPSAALAAGALRQNHTPPIALFMRSP